jgi:hypothetical protein
MPQLYMIRRPAAALVAAGLLFVGAVGCSSSSSSSAASGSGDRSLAGDPSVAGGSPSTSSGGGKSAGAVDPCQWYSSQEMEALLGFPMTRETQNAGADKVCDYRAPKNYSSVRITVSDDGTYNAQKNFAYTDDAIRLAGPPKAYTGLGDDAYGHESKGGADISARRGSTSVSVAITNGGGGPEAGKINTTDAVVAVAKQIVTKALG